MTGFSRYHTQLQTDSIGGKNISGKWFFEWDYGLSRPKEITDTVREQLIHGVAFELYEDSCKSNHEIVEEVQNMYPGNFRYFENYGNGSFIWERDCMTIFVKRIYPYQKGYSIPEVSFCYGLTSSQVSTYATYTGYFNSDPD
ncbi:hypothetical protein [Dyadobacter aurulentus]|uniref:hypothetical protein n=1 Tax=Dyadobacter sp. UC 10 TaxID=2605428 RepID=UPI0011F15CA1|nr:hypothetical protein [Dyadobacter sp. UC 10]KAA0990398.1 hypothetical protein FXO21_09635 [Dyadobacter sp. UC 10]